VDRKEIDRKKKGRFPNAESRSTKKGKGKGDKDVENEHAQGRDMGTLQVCERITDGDGTEGTCNPTRAEGERRAA